MYGFVTLDEDTSEDLKDVIGKEFEVNYKMYTRGKNLDEFEWSYLETATNVVKTTCKEGRDICTYFPVGFIPFIEFEMYDVGIELLPSESLSALHQVHVDFHIAYFNPAFTYE